MDIDLNAATLVAEQAARIAGEILLAMKGTAAVRNKSGKDLVTDADLAAQVAISKMLVAAFPDHGFLGEEGNTGVSLVQQTANEESPYQWVVDPLDGTKNYAHGFPQYAVSIALTYQQHPILGVIYDPESDELFRAAKGRGAFLNGQPIRTSQRVELSESLIAAGLSPNLQEDSEEVKKLIKMLTACGGLRRLGSAALNLCYVACGRLDGYWAGTLHIWDLAAGLLIVREASGVVTDFSGDDQRALQGALIAASTRELQHQITKVIA